MTRFQIATIKNNHRSGWFQQQAATHVPKYNLAGKLMSFSYFSTTPVNKQLIRPSVCCVTYQSYCCFWQRSLLHSRTQTVWTSAWTNTQRHFQHLPFVPDKRHSGVTFCWLEPTFLARIFLLFFSSSEPWWDLALVSLLCWWSCRKHAKLACMEPLPMNRNVIAKARPEVIQRKTVLVFADV